MSNNVRRGNKAGWFGLEGFGRLFGERWRILAEVAGTWGESFGKQLKMRHMTTVSLGGLPWAGLLVGRALGGVVVAETGTGGAGAVREVGK